MIRLAKNVPARPNEWVAARLEEVASLLGEQGASPFRVRAYRRGAASLRNWEKDPGEVLAAEGRPGLEKRAGIGRSLSGTIDELLRTGHLRLLERLRGQASWEDRFMGLPGIGPELANRIHEQLGVDSLEELEMAAWDGRLERVPGFGPRRVETLRAVLAQRLGPGPRQPHSPRPAEPPVAYILSVDREYREGAGEGRLRRIAPHRFNPTRSPWLPILHTERGPWSFQALFSNTARAHQLGRTRDWVVIFYERDGLEGQATVVTETSGDMAGERVVRGREEECRVLPLPARREVSRPGGPPAPPAGSLRGSPLPAPPPPPGR